jgi:hypothetical protein
MERKDLSIGGSGERRAVQGIVRNLLENNFTSLGRQKKAPDVACLQDGCRGAFVSPANGDCPLSER